MKIDRGVRGQGLRIYHRDTFEAVLVNLTFYLKIIKRPRQIDVLIDHNVVRVSKINFF